MSNIINWKTNIWKAKKKKKRRKEILNGDQEVLTDFGISEVPNITKKSSYCSKSVQTNFNIGGDSLMEVDPDLDGVNVKDLPQGETLEGEVSEIAKGERQEFYDPNEDGEYRFGEAEDVMLQFEIEVNYNGDKVVVYETVTYDENPDPRSNLGQIINRYGVPEVGDQVNVDFDKDGRGEMVY